MIDTLDLLRALQGAIVLLGLVVIYYAYKSYRKLNSKSMLFLAVGFLFVTAGTVLAGFLFEILGFELTSVHAVETAFRVVGFLFIVYSIIGRID